MRQHLYKSFFFSAILCLTSFFGSESRAQGKLLIQNFDLSDYGAEAQNWAVAQDSLGLVYIGNNEALLIFDAHRREKIKLPNGSTVRGLAKGPDGRIYVGGEGEMGYLAAADSGRRRFESLVNFLPEGERTFAEVWRIHASEEEVFFFTMEKVMIFKPSEKTFTSINIRAASLPSLAGDTYFFSDRKKGFVVLENGELTALALPEPYSQDQFFNVLPFREKFLLCGRKNGLLLFDKNTGEVSPFEHEAAELLREEFIYHAAILRSGDIALAGLSAGIYILSPEGKLKHHVQRDTHDLQNNMVNFIFEDRDGNLWAALNNGISYIELQKNIQYWDEKRGLEGHIYDILTFDSAVFTVGSKGLAVSEDYKNFQKISTSGTGAWTLLKAKVQSKEILVGGLESGVFQISKRGRNYKADSLLLLRQVFALHQSKIQPERLWVGYKNGLVLMEYDSLVQKFKFKKKIKNFDKEVRHITEDNEGRLWIGTLMSGLYRLDFQDNTADFKAYGKAEGLPGLQWVQAHYTDRGLLVSTKFGLYILKSHTEDRFIPFKTSHTDSPLPEDIYRFDTQSGKNWLIGQNFRKSLLAYEEKGEWKRGITARIPFSEVYAVHQNDSENVWVGTSRGLFRVPLQTDFKFDAKHEFRALIRNLRTEKEELFGNHELQFRPTVIPSEKNSLRVTGGASFFEDAGALMYRFRLKGYEEEFSAWHESPDKEYTRLPEGDYILELEVKDVYGRLSRKASLKLNVQAPFYLSKAAYAVYILLLIGLIWGIVRLNTLRLKNRNKKLEAGIRERTQKISAQKEEIEEQNQELETKNEKIEEAYKNIRLLSEIGQDITSQLGLEDIFHTVYRHVFELMDATIFGIGIYNPSENELNYLNIMEEGRKIAPLTQKLDEEFYLGVYCFKKQEEILIGDFKRDYRKYTGEVEPSYSGRPSESIVYVPLHFHEKRIGVLTVQAFRKNAYTEYHLNMMRNLANYICIALENAGSYQSIVSQKALLSRRNKHIMDSIRYAKRIQDAILPREEELQRGFPEHFVIFKPRDVVSGDFYYFEKLPEGRFIFACIDCTGHGVPGGFMSMITYEILNELILVKNFRSPAKILEEMDKQLVKALRQEHSDVKDGLDILLALYSPEEQQLDFGGAHHRLYMRKADENQEFEIYDTTRRSVGGTQKRQFPFEQTRLNLQKGDIIYLSSDGFQDQFGGDKGQKYMRKRFHKLLSAVSLKPLSEQPQILENELEEWKGNSPQVDDVLIMAFKIS